MQPVVDTPFAIALAGLGLVAAFFDFRFRRIPNWLTAAGFCAGLALHSTAAGWAGLRTALLGAGLATAIYLLLYLLRAVGGGDLKLMAAIGAIVGPEAWLVLFVITSLLGAAAAIVIILTKGRVRRTLSNIGLILSELAHLRLPYRRHAELDVASASATRMPHGVAIAAAIGLYLLAR